jgi:hypothetical protein
LHIDLAPHIVFHSDGYKDEGENIIQNFAEGKYLDVPGLDFLGAKNLMPYQIQT